MEELLINKCMKDLIRINANEITKFEKKLG